MAIHIKHDKSRLNDIKLTAIERNLAQEIATIQDAAKGMYETPYASINLSLDNNHLKQAKALAKKYRKASLLIVVGIGGSNLGTIAVQEAILGKYHNLNPKKSPRVLYADTIDISNMNTINSLLELELKKGGKKSKAVINLISKSGGTTETIANFEILYNTLKKYKKTNSKEFVVVTTDDGSHLWHFAKDQGFKILSMPKTVGGRYSVLSPVGLFPLALLGININKLMDGAAHMRASCLTNKHGENPAILRAAMLKNANDSGINIADNFYFKTDLESIGKWYRQLMGESIGKEYNKDKTKILHSGITPTVSIGSTDLHSMAQLYFGGPSDKFFTIVTIKPPSSTLSAKNAASKSKSSTSIKDIIVPNMHEYDALVPNIQNKKLSTIMSAISSGVMATLESREMPYCHIELDRCDEETIGALLQLHMIEMMFLGALFDVNPFDQPNVEEYKIETKKFLARSNK